MNDSAFVLRNLDGSDQSDSISPERERVQIDA